MVLMFPVWFSIVSVLFEDVFSFLVLIYWIELTTVDVCACMLSHFSRVWSFAMLWTVAHQAPLSMQGAIFSRREYWSGLPCRPPGDLPNTGMEIEVFLHLLHCRQILYPLSHLGSPTVDKCEKLKKEIGLNVNTVKRTSFIILPGYQDQLRWT